MAWKVERWLAEVFPGKERIYEEYRNLPARELAIVSAAVLDLALAELLTLRLADIPKEVEEFLGLDSNGRAAAGSFGARIQLGLLVGLLTSEDAAMLRAMKGLRNEFAHRVRVSFTSPGPLKVLEKIFLLWMAHQERTAEARGVPPAALDAMRELRPLLATSEDACQGLLLAAFSTYQAMFHRMHGRVTRLDRPLFQGSRPASDRQPA
jgi:hypothetical protein